MEIGTAIGLFGGIIAICGTIYTIYSNKKKNENIDTTEARINANESKDDGRQIGTILTELGYIKSSVDDIKRKQDQQDARHIELVQKIAGYDEFKRNTENRLENIEDSIKDIKKTL